MSNPTLHHVNLKTTRLKEMIDWYGTVVGLKPHHVAPVGAWLTNDAANHRLALLAFPGMSDDVDKDSHTGLHHTAFEFSSLGLVHSAAYRLSASLAVLGHSYPPLPYCDLRIAT